MFNWRSILMDRCLSSFLLKTELRHDLATDRFSVVFRKGPLFKEVFLKPETVEDLKNLCLEHDRFFEETYRMQFHENTAEDKR